MNKLRTASFAAVLFALGAAAHADTVKLDGATAMTADDGRPSRGMTQQRVQAKYGQPQSTKSPVGDPPITRWEYQDFVVFFEYDKVIHAVLKR